jgi:uncharacterized protein YjiK
MLLLLAAISIAACGGRHPKEKKMEQPVVDSTSSASITDPSSKGIPQALAWYDLKEREPESFELPKKLREISGIAFTSDGRLFAHGDERGAIFQLDTSSGEVVKEFYLGEEGGVRGDFEDIEIVDRTFYLMRSDGDIFEFSEGGENEVVQYKEYQTFLKGKNDVEGLCYDPTTRALLLACKGDPGSGNDDAYKGVYSFPLLTRKLDEKPRFLLPVADLTRQTGEERFNTSAIVRHPVSGTFLLIASSGNAIAEVSADGRVLGSLHLKRSVHTPPEGIAVSPEMTLYISDEGREGKGRLTKYPIRHTQ